MKQDYTKINLDLPIEMKNKLMEEAREKEMSLSGLIRLILKFHLKEYSDGKNL